METISNLELHIIHQTPNDQDQTVGNSWNKEAWEEIFDHGNDTNRGSGRDKGSNENTQEM